MNRRSKLIGLAVTSAVVALAVAILGNLVSDDLSAQVQPYIGWVYGGLAVLFALSLILLVWQMRISGGDSATRIDLTAKNGGKVEENKVCTPGADSVEVTLTASGNGSTLKDNTVEVGKTPSN